MCGIIELPGGQKVEIDCELIDPFWWRHPWPPVDLTRLRIIDENPGEELEPWRGELTKIGDILSVAGKLSDPVLADRLAGVAVEVGNTIAENAKVDISFGWEAHG